MEDMPADADAILAKLSAIIADHFTVPASIIDFETQAHNVMGWDSIAHTILILKVEDSFGIEFDENDIFELNDVGQLVRLISQCLARQQPQSP